jgi:hypothetical protein
VCRQVLGIVEQQTLVSAHTEPRLQRAEVEGSEPLELPRIGALYGQPSADRSRCTRLMAWRRPCQIDTTPVQAQSNSRCRG